MSWVDVTTAVGTAGAAVVALSLGLRAEWRAIRAERQAKEENERRQAIHVAAWTLVEQDNGEGLREINVEDPSFDERNAHVYEVVQNASEEPIWDVVVDVLAIVEEHKEFKLTHTNHEIVSIGPYETRKSEVTALPYNRLPLKVEFRDNAGRDWSRDEEGRLHRGRTSRTFLDAATNWLNEATNEKSVGQQKNKNEEQ